MAQYFRKQLRHTSLFWSPRKGYLSAWMTWTVYMFGASSTGASSPFLLMEEITYQ
jgi:hypothetical protein